MNRFPFRALTAASLALMTTPTVAQVTTFPDDVVIEGSLKVQVPSTGSGNPSQGSLYVEANSVIDGALCVGNSCSESEVIPNETALRLKYTNVNIEFEDTSGSSLPDRDWTLRVNDSNSIATGGIERFSIEDRTAGTIPFTIAGGVPENAFWLDTSGDLGLGTAMPGADLHIANPTSTAQIRLDSTSGTPRAWDIGGGSVFSIQDDSAVTTPFVISGGAPTNAVWINATGNVGLGTGTPEGKLHTKGDGVQLAYFESSDGDAVQVRFRTDSQNRRFLAVNNANEVKSQIVFGDNQITFLGQTVANEWLRISDAGIISSGPSCSASPCDLTFDPEYFTVPPIEERAAYMWENMHLPAVGPTGPEQPFNVTEKMGGVIHELEIAHIYIEQLHDEILALRADHSATLAAQAADLQELRKLIEAN